MKVHCADSHRAVLSGLPSGNQCGSAISLGGSRVIARPAAWSGELQQLWTILTEYDAAVGEAKAYSVVQGHHHDQVAELLGHAYLSACIGMHHIVAGGSPTAAKDVPSNLVFHTPAVVLGDNERVRKVAVDLALHGGVDGWDSEGSGGGSFVGGQQSFSVIKTPTVKAMDVLSGPTSGGTRIYVGVDGLDGVEALYLVFCGGSGLVLDTRGETVAADTVYEGAGFSDLSEEKQERSEGQTVTVAERLQHTGPVIEFHTPEFPRDGAFEIRIGLLPTKRGTLPVAVPKSTDGTVATFVVYSQPHFSGIEPNVGPVRGGTVVDIHGTDLPVSESAVVRFHHSDVDFEDVDVLPGHSTSRGLRVVVPRGRTVGPIRGVSVALNGQQFVPVGRHTPSGAVLTQNIAGTVATDCNASFVYHSDLVVNWVSLSLTDGAATALLVHVRQLACV